MACPRRLVLASRIALVLLLGSYLLLSDLAFPLPVKRHVAPLRAHFAPDQPQILAHRGSRCLAPENTLAAFRAALALGADVLETDVRITADERLAIVHDEYLTRTTESDAAVRSLTLAEIQRLDAAYWFSPDANTYDLLLRQRPTATAAAAPNVSFPMRGKGTTVPSLPEILDAFPQARWNIEIKDDDERAVRLLVAELDGRPGLADRVVVGSGRCNMLRLFREQSASRYATSACETEAAYLLLPSIARVTRAVFSQWRFPDSLEGFQLPHRSGYLQIGDARTVQHIHELGLRAHYWVVNSEPLMHALLAIGADAIITDRPDLAYRVLHQIGKRPPLPPPPAAAIFYEPTYFFEEQHTCLTWTCTVSTLVLGSELLRTALLAVLVLAALWWVAGGGGKKRPKSD